MQARPFDGVRILDFCHELGSYCTRLFAELGAEVIRVEPPGGRKDRRMPPAIAGCEAGGVPYAFLNASKKSVVLDETMPSGQEALRRLIAASAIVVIESEGDPADAQALLDLAKSVPGARVVAAISPFGLTGPHAAHRSCDLVAQARGGIAWLSGVPERAPLRLAGSQSLFVTSLYAATTIAAALWDCECHGNSHVLDISAQECLAHSLQNTLQRFDLEGAVFQRGGLGSRDATEAVFRCADGYVFLASPLTLPLSWKALVDWMREEGHPGAARLSEPDWQDSPSRTSEAMRTEFKTIFESFIADKTRAAMREEALRRRVILAPVNAVGDLGEDPQLAFRKFFQHVAGGTEPLRFPGAPYALSQPVWQIAHAAPRLGEHDAMLTGAMP